MSGDGGNNENSAIHEISRKNRLSISVITFVIVTLFAVIVRYLYKPLSSTLDFLPDISIGLIVGITFFLSLIGLFLSMTMSKQVLRIVRDYSNRLEKLLNITRDLREEVYGDILLEKVLDNALSITNSEAGSVLLVEEGKLVFKVAKGEKSEDLIGTTVETGRGIAGWVAETGTAVRVADAAKDDRFNPDVDARTGYETHSILCVPLKTTSGVVGVLELLNRKGGYLYRERDEEIIVYLAEQAAISIIKTRFYEDQKNYEIHLTDMLLEAIDFHIPEKRGHSRRVARYGNMIARSLDMSEEEKKKLYFASLLHDVGFLKINADSAFKKEEFMRHPVVGYEMIKPINFYSDIAAFILYHHERYDGYGYPERLKGNDIPLEARIIAVAEAFDAMISATSYRIPVGFDEAVAELRRKAGTQFDPWLVDVFVSTVEPQHVMQ
jgi:HD-GYP domain-containing protein (c-di-GMP phosphodiesterase class II)